MHIKLKKLSPLYLVTIDFAFQFLFPLLLLKKYLAFISLPLILQCRITIFRQSESLLEVQSILVGNITATTATNLTANTSYVVTVQTLVDSEVFLIEVVFVFFFFFKFPFVNTQLFLCVFFKTKGLYKRRKKILRHFVSFIRLSFFCYSVLLDSPAKSKGNVSYCRSIWKKN